ncbi:MAG: molybdopterin molybdotransferase MoeA, partial [Sphingomonadaceae bacterium]|nr:molybdopterin molybdotransferase MoeA [Sphingomonadaceae bacterium]
MVRVISVDEAQARLLTLASPTAAVELPLASAAGHYLAENVIARRTQPAADLSAMDGYAIRFEDMPGPWRMIGESAAGRPFGRAVGSGEAVRIFTGAHVPPGCNAILVQEEAARDGGMMTLAGEGPPTSGSHIRRKAGDFCEGDVLLKAGDRLHAGAVAAAAMAGYGSVKVGRGPKVAIIASGDELLPPGDPCDPAHIPSSNNVMLGAMLAGLPCSVEDKGIVRDNLADLEAALRSCDSFDIIVTSGGASVGDHDLVQQALRNVGAEIDFWKVAMRPGKPVMAGRLGRTTVLGLPGNPSSAFVTALLFLLPLVRHLAGSKLPFPETLAATVAHDLPAGGARTDYWRAVVENGLISVFAKQDSGMLHPLTQANALLINPANAPA